MTKEEQLRALRELTDANGPANKANAVVDDIAVVKWLDAHRRKATAMEDIEVIDAIMHGLFHQGVNKISGRVHGMTADVGWSPAAAEEKPKTDRKAYMRELMRKKRAAKQD